MNKRSQSSSLTGKRIVVTQATHQAHELCALLVGRGAHPLSYPCIAIEPPAEADALVLDDALRRAAGGGFDWLVLTSANTVRVLAGRLVAFGLTGSNLSALAVAAVGSATARAVEDVLGLKVAVLAEEQQAEGLAAALLLAWHGQGGGQRVLLPQGNLARPVLAQRLAEAGAQVVAGVAYRTVLGRDGVKLADLLAAGQVDAVTFTSSSTVVNCCERLRLEGGDFRRLAAIHAVCIGPLTAQTAASLRFDRPIIAQTPSIESLVDALETIWGETIWGETIWRGTIWSKDA